MYLREVRRKDFARMIYDTEWGTINISTENHIHLRAASQYCANEKQLWSLRSKFTRKRG